MSDFTNQIFAPVITQVEQLEAQRNSLNTQIAALQATVATLQGQISAPSRDNKLATILVASLYYMAYVPKIDYVFGGESVSGMDCSGFMQTIFKVIGVNLPRVSANQINTGTSIEIGKEQPGDLLGFDLGTRNGSGIEHIGMCIGNGLMIHTAKPGEGICISNYHTRYGSHLVKIARVF